MSAALPLVAKRPATGEEGEYAGPPTTVDTRLTMGHYYFFAALGASRGIIHDATLITGQARWQSEELQLCFEAPPDRVWFALRLAPELGQELPANSYALRSAAQPQAPVAVAYYYARQLAASSQAHAQLAQQLPFQQLTGHLTISVYHAQQQLLSGYYEVRFTRPPDPATGLTGLGCTLLLAGEFEHLAVTRAT
ncbi:hypothetical protein Q5H93_06475 [Hymenobacter sp. ASUV-10]|uniref:Uncharacterized protein n=1 Tax=Hymenobacter aranciens TaxID=3063996 RepID=A0ABT9B7X4_9BACT|nr:hypothetical protein [Hymenobacter sp. ASUV-10]MDO7874371.1 hypothetical protein [Hymenobacter sp. ASUV-10]